MAFTPGGRSDKFGNHYESMWVANRLLDVLLENKYRTVTVESIGEAEVGVDLWVEDYDGNQLAEQCKARNGSSEKWSVADLKNVIKNIPIHITEQNTKSYRLISPIPFYLLDDLCIDAQNSEDSEEYYSTVVGSSIEKKKVFSQFCKYLSLSEKLKGDRQKAYIYLKHFNIEFYPSTDKALEDLKSRALLLFSGSPDLVVSLLRTYIIDEKMLGKEINAQCLLNYLEKSKIYPRMKIDDHRLSGFFHSLKASFNDSISNILIADTLIERTETNTCFSLLDLNTVVILHGEAGRGKSGVLYEFIQKLEQDDIQCVPIKLDRNIPRGSTKEFGIQIGLPDSPSKCLASYSGKKRAVLILDQLDAIRWTSENSLESIGVCKQLIKEVLSYNKYNEGNLRVVIVCRTFDLENDPEIKNWLLKREHHDQFAKLEIKDLDEKDISKIVGPRLKELSNAQINILKNPQNLYMWQELRDEGMSFINHADLMRLFWRFKRSKLEKAGLKRNEVDTALASLVSYMEKHGEISSPERLLNGHSKEVVDALLSHSIIQKQSGRTSFCHQSYLDYLIADKVFHEIDNGGSVLSWLGEKREQNLYRRQQLSLFLFLLVKESQGHFIGIAREILFSKDVRFHIKHLVFEVYSQISDASIESLELLDELIISDEWRGHTIRVSVMRNASLVHHLVKNGVLSSWLESKSKDRNNDALSIIHSVVVEHPHIVSAILIDSYKKGHTSKESAYSSLGYHFADDTEELFEFRLCLISDGITLRFIDWKNLASRKPLYALKTIELLAKIETKCEGGDLSSYDRKMYDHDLNPIFTIVETHYLNIWNSLFEFSSKVLKQHNNEKYTSRYKSFDIEKTYSNRRSYLESFADLCIVLVIESGKKLAELAPDILIEQVSNKSKDHNSIPDNALGLLFLNLPLKYSDFVIGWLLENEQRLFLGLDFQRSKWMIAADLLTRFSVKCEISLFKQIEEKLYKYTPSDENFKRSYKYHIQNWRHDCYFPAWGEAQYFLLPCLYKIRTSPSTKELIHVLNRKFDCYSASRFFSGSNSNGGLIGSKLEPNIEKISDQSWIDIITNKKTKRRHDHSTWEQVSKDLVHVSSHDVFSGSLERVAKRNPKRFSKIFDLLPVDINPMYISSILSAFSLIEAETGNNEKDSIVNWEKSSVQEIEKLWAKYSKLQSDREVARSFCWLIKKRSKDNWSQCIIDDLIDLAIKHKDPKKEDLNVSLKDETYDKASSRSLQSTAMNSVRGSAIEALGALLWENKLLSQVLEKNMESFLKDKHLSILMSIQSIIYPMLNIDKDKAINWFVKSCSRDLRVVCTRQGVHFLNNIISSRDPDLVNIIRKMVNFGEEEVDTLAGEMVVFYTHCYDGLFASEFEKVKNGNSSTRKGVVNAAKNLVRNDKFAFEARKLLASYFDDPDKEVRIKSSNIFYDDNLLNTPENLELALDYINSKAFLDGDTQLFNRIEEYGGSLVKFSQLILDACKKILQSNRDSTDYHLVHYDQKRYVTILIRLYDQAGSDSELRNKCLDVWDMFFKENVEMTRDITNIISK